MRIIIRNRITTIKFGIFGKSNIKFIKKIYIVEL